MFNFHSVPKIDDDFLKLFGFVLAYGHCYYEDSAGLQNLQSRLEMFRANEKIEFKCTRKLILISSSHGYIQVDKNNTDMTNGLRAVPIDCAGTINRNFSVAVYKVIHKNGERTYHICDSPSCLITMHRIRKYDKSRLVNLTVENCRTVYFAFAEMLSTLLSKNPACARKYKIHCGESKSLIKYLSNDVVLQTLTKLNCDINYENMGFIFSYQYYFNYLSWILPSLGWRFREYKKTLAKHHRCYSKLIVVIPMSGCVEAKLNDTSLLCGDSIQYAEELKILKRKVGISMREFKATVYKLLASHCRKHMQPVEHKDFYCYVEFATPIKTMRRMMDERVGNISEIFAQEIDKFHFWLQKLITSQRSDDLVSVVVWDDRRERDNDDDVDDDPTYRSLIETLQAHCADSFE